MSGRYTVGFELNSDTSQLAVYSAKDGDAMTLPTRVGSTDSRFPTALYKKAEGGFVYGLEAAYFENKAAGTPVRNLLAKALNGHTQMLDGRQMSGTELLAEFFRGALRVLGEGDPSALISVICVTGRNADEAFAAAVQSALGLLGFSRKQIQIAPFDECFYRYVYAGKPEYYSRGALLLEFGEDEVSASKMTEYRIRKPQLVTMEELGRKQLPRESAERDGAFSKAFSDWAGGKSFSSIYLSGKGFGREWAKESLPLLSKAASHVFAGDNLYVKGACLLAEAAAKDSLFGERVFYGQASVEAGLSMEVTERGRSGQLVLIRAGENRFTAGTSFELILGDTEELVFLKNELFRPAAKELHFPLPGLPLRPARATRLLVTVQMRSCSEVLIKAEDLGFGELFPDGGRTWEQVFDLTGEEKA